MEGINLNVKHEGENTERPIVTEMPPRNRRLELAGEILKEKLGPLAEGPFSRIGTERVLVDPTFRPLSERS